MSARQKKIGELEEKIRSLEKEVKKLKKGDEEETQEKKEVGSEIVPPPPLPRRRVNMFGWDDFDFPVFRFRFPSMRELFDTKEEEEEEEEEEEYPTPYTYSSTYSYSKVNDLVHEKKKVEDSRSGIQKEMESRRIGNRVVKVEKKRKGDDEEEEVKRTMKNMEMKDLEGFEKEWKDRVLTGKKRKMIQQSEKEEETKSLEPPEKKRKLE